MIVRLSLLLAAAALLILCGCSSYEVTSSGDPEPLPEADRISLSVEVCFAPDNTEPATQIDFIIPEACWVNLNILNATGYQVKRLIDGEFGGGGYTVSWDMRDDDGNGVKSGIYFYRLEACDMVFVKAGFFCRTPEDCENMTDEKVE